MPRGELKDYILLCSYEDKEHVLHGIGMRKNITGSLKIEIASVERSSFTPEDGLIISADGDDSRIIHVNPELLYVRANSSSLRKFSDTDDVKDAISLLLNFALNQILDTYYGCCMVQVADTLDPRPAFVFVSCLGQVTAFPFTTTALRMPATIYVNHLQPGLRKRSFWRACCFELLDHRPRIQKWAKDVDVNALRSAIVTTVLTFNALNGEPEELCDENGEYQETLNSLPCGYDPRL